jgi:importin-5
VLQVAEAHPRFMRRQLGEVVAAMLQIAGAHALDDATRQLAAEFLITLCEARDKAPGMMRKLPSFAEQIFQIMLKFLLDIEVRPAAFGYNL